MGRRRQSGIFETLFKSAFGVGTTVHHARKALGKAPNEPTRAPLGLDPAAVRRLSLPSTIKWEIRS